MSSPRLIIAVCAALVLLVAATGAGIWWYLYGPNQIDSAELVPANTLVFVSIPNAATLVEGFQSSKAKALLDNPGSKPIRDSLIDLIGPGNVDLIQSFLPNLSGQSFVAVTQFDYQHPEQAGLIAAMKPKAGLGDFGQFLAKLKEAWPGMLKQGQTGKGTVEGVPYDWIRGPGAADKICVAQVGGWIVTSWGEEPLQDWIQRFQRKATTSSLAHDANYQKTISRVGDDPMALTYVNLQAVLEIAGQQITRGDRAHSEYLAKKLQSVGGAAVATRFENREIVDRYSVVFPKPAQLDSGMTATPCAFDTLKFTGPDTRFYWAANVNWQRYYDHLKEQKGPAAYYHTSYIPAANELLAFLQDWTRGANIDGRHNVAGALGPEISLQVEWNKDETFPEVGLLVKVDKPDDFKPTIDAIKESVQKAYAASGVVHEVESNGQKFVSLHFGPGSALSPTMTESGPYFGIFETENQAVHSFQRDASVDLTHRAEFTSQIGDLRNGATQIFFLDSPYLLDRAYRTAMPYVSLAGMFDKHLGAFLQGKNFPDDLSWLAPMGTWSCVMTSDEEGIQAYSVSGIGNQGIVLFATLGEGASILKSLGYLPQFYTSPASATPSAAGLPTPAASVPAAMSTPFHAVIFITADNKILFDETPVASSELTDFLKTQRTANASMTISVRVDKNSSPDILSGVMDSGMTAGFGVLPYTYATVPAPGSTIGNGGNPASPPASSGTNSLNPRSTNSDVNPPNSGPLHP